MTTMDPNKPTKKGKPQVDVRCRTCRFWTAPMFNRGTCKEGPPVASTTPGHSSWPMTDEQDWCGRHKPSDAALAEAAAAMEAEAND